MCRVYVLQDSLGYDLNKYFDSWSKADSFRNLMGRPDWKIREIIKK